MTARHAFPQQHRLLNAGDYQRVFNQTAYKISDHYLLILASISQEDQSRLGLVVSKRNVRLAINRNRVKRLVRESFRHQSQFPISVDLIVLAHRGIGDLTNTNLHRLLERQWQKLRKKLLKITL